MRERADRPVAAGHPRGETRRGARSYRCHGAKPCRGTHVLLVEDDDVRDVLTELLEIEGFEATSVRDGREALDYLHAHEPHCLIVLSAASDELSLARAMRADGYFAKPVVFEAFVGALRAKC
jgi:PleD family two-component response regulator